MLKLCMLGYRYEVYDGLSDSNRVLYYVSVLSFFRLTVFDTYRRV